MGGVSMMVTASTTSLLCRASARMVKHGQHQQLVPHAPGPTSSGINILKAKLKRKY
jgi:hypothetical protein